jgi:hypothetical protein
MMQGASVGLARRIRLRARPRRSPRWPLSGFRLTTMQIDLASRPVGASEVAIRVRIDKRTKSIVFASVEAMAGEQMVFRAQGLFGKR